jgi:hypothetical protein
VSTSPSRKYDPRAFKALTFHDAAARFRDGVDTPRAYLERCLETIAEREPAVKAFVALNEQGARESADASTARWKAGRPLSPIDGMPIGIKDLLETKDMPTQMGCEAFRGNFPKRDNAAVWALRQAGAGGHCARQVEFAGRRQLHPAGEFVVSDARVELCIVGVVAAMAIVQPRDQVQ